MDPDPYSEFGSGSTDVKLDHMETNGARFNI